MNISIVDRKNCKKNMRRRKVPIAEKRVLESMTKHNSSQRKLIPTDQKVTRKNFLVSMVNTRSAKENKTRGSAEEGRTELAIEIDLETPDQSVDEVEKKTTESTPMANAEEQKQKSMEFSPIDTLEDTLGNTPETTKDESQAKRTSFTEMIAMIIGMKSRDIVGKEQKAEKGKTFGTVSTKTTEVNRDDDQSKHGATASHGATADHETTNPLELGDLMAELDQIDKRLKCSEEDWEVINKKLRYNKHEYLDNFFNLAKAMEEKLQQMSDKVEATDKDREGNINKEMHAMKQRYDAVNSQLGSLETRMDTMSRDQAESSCTIQAKLDAILRNSTSHDRPVTDGTQSNRTVFVEPQRNKRESTPLPLPRGAASVGPGGGGRTIIKSWTSTTTNGPGNSTISNNVGPDAMTWASTWEMMIRSLEAFATRNTDSSERGGGKSRKTFKKPKEIKND